MAPSDPQSDPQRQVNGLVQKDQQKNSVAVHSFDPNASPAEKAAAAGKGRDQLKSVKTEEPNAGGKGKCYCSFPERLRLLRIWRNVVSAPCLVDS